ncbi:MAG TPA: RNA polymerase sigma factor [Gaiellaceae bacterium]|nr:RNA polymerase sigma factor [Gaiellaceae bacterium]
MAAKSETVPAEAGVEPPPPAAGSGLDAHDRETLADLRSGDERAFAALVAEHGPSLLRVASLFVSSRAVAEEVVQETWMGFLNGLDRFEGRSSVKTWLFRILANIAKTRAVREARAVPFSSLGDRLQEKPSVDPDRFFEPGHRWDGHWSSAPQRWDDAPEARLVARETRGVIEQAIAALPDSQRAVVSLRDVEGWSSKEVCELLSISEGNQRVLLHRARSRVRATLEDYLADDA